MSLTEKINQDLKDALKGGEKDKLEVLRMIRAQIIEFSKRGGNQELDEQKEIELLNSMVKSRLQSIQSFKEGGREDLVAKEEYELNIMKKYLPEQISREELQEGVASLGVELEVKGKQDFGKLMQATVAKFKGRVDGKVIKETVEQYLSSF